MNIMTFISIYKDKLPILEKVSEDIKKLLNVILRDTPRKDGILIRVKSVESFREKSLKKDDKGKKKYKKPLEEIQDQIGARIIVYYKSDVESVTKKILDEFCEVESKIIEQPDPEAFSYQAKHIVCLIPPDIESKYNSPIDFFELQICTLFQHAWAVANHDLGYKSIRDLEYLEKRKIAWAASQAWGADLIFDELWNDLNR